MKKNIEEDFIYDENDAAEQSALPNSGAAAKAKRKRMSLKQWIVLGVTAIVCGVIIYNIAAAMYLMTTTKRDLSFSQAIKLVLPSCRADFVLFLDTEQKNGLYSDYSGLSATEQIKDKDGNVISEVERPIDYLTQHQINLLVLGLDENKTNTDVILVVSIDLSDSEDTRSINILQIPRDTFVGEELAGSKTGKINGVYSHGNPELTQVNRLIEVIYKQFDIHIDHYLACDLDGFKDIVDALGGIPMNVPQQITYDADSIIYPGQQTLNGEQSEWFVRYRKGYYEGDIGREKMQRLFMASALSRAKDMDWTDLKDLLPELVEYCTSDMTVSELEDILYVGTNLEFEDVSIFMVPGEATNYGPKEYSVWTVHLDSTVELLNTHFRKYQKDIEKYDLGIIELANTIDKYENTEDNFQELLDGQKPGEKNE